MDILQVIKDYGAAIISTISVGGIAAAVGVIIKIKGAIDKTRETMQAAIAKKDKVIDESNVQLQSVVEQNKQLVGKIDELTQDVYKLESEVRSNVKGNGKG